MLLSRDEEALNARAGDRGNAAEASRQARHAGPVLAGAGAFESIPPARTRRALLPVDAFVGQTRAAGESHADLFRTGCYGYFVTGLVLIAVLKWRTHTTAWHIYVLVVIDVAVLSLIVYASGGADGGLAILLVVPVGALSVIAGTRGSLLIAAAAVLALLGQQFAAFALDGASPVGFAQAGYYGAVLLLVAAGGAFMTRRLRETEEVIRLRWRSTSRTWPSCPNTSSSTCARASSSSTPRTASG